MYYVKQGKQQTEEWVKQTRRNINLQLLSLFFFPMFIDTLSLLKKQASEWMNEWMNERTVK